MRVCVCGVSMLACGCSYMWRSNVDVKKSSTLISPLYSARQAEYMIIMRSTLELANIAGPINQLAQGSLISSS